MVVEAVTNWEAHFLSRGSSCYSIAAQYFPNFLKEGKNLDLKKYTEYIMNFCVIFAQGSCCIIPTLVYVLLK